MTYIAWGGLILLLVYEIWAIVNRKPGDTITEVIRAQRPIIPFTFGVVMGHLFWH